MRPSADRDRQVRDDNKMSHFLDGDGDDRLAPSLQRIALGVGDALFATPSQAERGIEVAAHQRVLDLRGLGEEVQELLARTDVDFGFRTRRLCHSRRPTIIFLISAIASKKTALIVMIVRP